MGKQSQSSPQQRPKTPSSPSSSKSKNSGSSNGSSSSGKGKTPTKSPAKKAALSAEEQEARDQELAELQEKEKSKPFKFTGEYPVDKSIDWTKVIAEQKKKQKAWVEKEKAALDDVVAGKNAQMTKESDSALRVVILIWVLMCAGIFYHVYSTIQGKAPWWSGQDDDEL
jgi:hypothetical protein